jgi:hypothetical protein
MMVLMKTRVSEKGPKAALLLLLSITTYRKLVTPTVSTTHHRNFSVLPPVCRRGAGRDCPPRMRCRRCRPQAGHPGRGSVLPPLELGGSCTRSSRPVPAGKAPGPEDISTVGSSKCRSGSAPPEPGRRFVPGKRFGPVTDAGQDASPKAGLPVPGRGVWSAPGPRWPGQGQAAHDFRPTAPSTTLGGNRAPGRYR